MTLYKNSIIKMPQLSVYSVVLAFLPCYFFGLVSGQGSIQYQSNSQDASPYIVNPPVEIVPYYNANPYQYQQQQPQHGQGQFGVKNVQSSTYHNVQPLYFTSSQNAQTENPAQPLAQIPDTYNPNYNFPANNQPENYNPSIKNNNNNIHIIPALTTEYTNPSQSAGLPLYQNIQNQNQNPNENLITQQNAYYQYPSNVNTLIQNPVPLNQNNVQNIQPQFTTNPSSNPNPINNNYYQVNPGVTTSYANNNNNNNIFGLGNVQTTRTYFGNFNTNANNNNNNIVNSGLQFGPTAFSTAPSTNFGTFGGSSGNGQEYQQFTLNPYVPTGVSSTYNYGITSSGEQFGFSSSGGSSGPSGFPSSASSNTATVIETFKALDKTQEFQNSLNKNLNSVQTQQPLLTEKPKKTSNSVGNGFSNLISVTKSLNNNNNNNLQVYSKGKQVVIAKNNSNNATTPTSTTTTATKSSQRQNDKNNKNGNNYKTKEAIYSTKILVNNNFNTRSSVTTTKPTTTASTTPKPTTKTTPVTTENIKTTTESIVFGRRLTPIKSIRNRNKSLFNIDNQNDDEISKATVSSS